MRIALLRPLPDPTRWSMDRYAQELHGAIRPFLNPGEEMACFPSSRDFSSWNIPWNHAGAKLLRYAQQYLLYGLSLHPLEADLYHITDHGYSHLIPFLPAKKVVVTFHDALLPNLEQRKLPVAWRPLSAIWAQKYGLRCLERADAIITVSNFAREELLRYSKVSSDKVVTIHEGVSELFQHPLGEDKKLAFRKRWDAEGKCVLLLPGRNDPHKNIEGMLTLLKKLILAYRIPAVLLKMGSGFNRGQARLIRELGLEASVRTLGPLAPEEVPLAYQASDALFFLSWYEGFGLPALEAMSAGIPAVVSNRGSLPEVVQGAAAILDPHDQDQAAKELYRVLTDQAFRQGLIEKGKKRAAQFSWQEAALKTLELYRRLLQNKRDETCVSGFKKG